jgi:phosphoenolpyruvate carboxylase
MNPAEEHQVETADKNLPLREDIRLLGAILGDTVRAQEGETVFALVEGIRQTSVRFHHDEDQAARGELEALLNGLSPEQTTRIIRAFSVSGVWAAYGFQLDAGLAAHGRSSSRRLAG